MKLSLFSILVALTVSSSAFSQEIEECKIAKPADDLSAANAAVTKMREECLPRMRRVSECITRTRMLSESVSSFIGKFRKPTTTYPLLVSTSEVGSFDLQHSDINIWRNFLSLEMQYNQSLDAVKALSERYRNIPAEAPALRSTLDDLDRDYSKTAKLIGKLSENEYKLLIFIEAVKKDLEGSYSRIKEEAIWLTSEECKNAQVAPVVLQLQGAFIKFFEDTDMIHTHIMEAKKARQNLVNYTYTAIRSRIETAYSQKLVDDLSTLGGKIDTIIRANRLSAKFENWYSWSAFEPNRDNILTIYQQFEESRKILAADLISAQDFKEQMLAVSDAHPETAEFYLNRMDSVISETKNRLQRLETKGWQGYLSSQKASANRIVSTPEKLTPECLALYQGFLDQVSAIDTLEKFRVGEKVFMKAVIGCTRKKS